MKNQLIRIMEAEGLSPAKFADEIGVQRSNISHILSDRNKPSYDFIIKILSRFSELNAEWLITGKGSMLKSGESKQIMQITQPSLFDQPQKNNQNTLGNESITKTKESVNDSNNPKNRTVEPLENKVKNEILNQVTNVTSIEQVLFFYVDGTFKIFTPK